MSLDSIALRTSISMEEARYVLALNYQVPISRSSIEKMIATGELKKPSRRGRFKVWSKSYISQKEDMTIDDINNILREVEKNKAG